MNWRTVLVVLLAVASSGCAGSLLESRAEPLTAYRLEGLRAEDRGERLPMVLAVARPRAAAALDTDRIAVDQPGHVFDYYAGIRWSEAAPQMLQQLLVNALSADGRYAAVVAAPSRVPADQLLDVELRRFEAVYDGAASLPVVRVEMQVSLLDARGSRRLASFLATGSAPATANGRAAVMDAFERATADALSYSVAQVRQSAVP